jgi:hypothetical protein
MVTSRARTSVKFVGTWKRTLSKWEVRGRTDTACVPFFISNETSDINNCTVHWLLAVRISERCLICLLYFLRSAEDSDSCWIIRATHQVEEGALRGIRTELDYRCDICIATKEVHLRVLVKRYLRTHSAFNIFVHTPAINKTRTVGKMTKL